VGDKEIKIPCEVWSRVVGFFRPYSQFNPGKKQEFRDRKTYNVEASFANRQEFMVSDDNT